jgi:hypothetical protein
MHLVRTMTIRSLAANMVQNDQYFISHKHQAEDGLPNLEELTAGETVHPDNASTSSVVHTPPFVHAKRLPKTALFSNEVRSKPSSTN